MFICFSETETENEDEDEDETGFTVCNCELGQDFNETENENEDEAGFTVCNCELRQGFNETENEDEDEVGFTVCNCEKSIKLGQCVHYRIAQDGLEISEAISRKAGRFLDVEILHKFVSDRS